jgi:hypothetical protein
MDARAQFLARAAERRTRLANLTSPAFDAWFEQHMIEFSAEPFPIMEALLMAHSRGRTEACITRDTQQDSG